MSNSLKILLIVFSLVFSVIVLRLVSKDKLSIKYSLIWLTVMLVLLLVGCIPDYIGIVTKKIGFETTSNFVIGLILGILLFITLILTVLIADQKNKIKLLIQEISILKKEKKDERKKL